MKVKTVIKLAALAVVLSFSVVGCKKGLDRTTPLPGRGLTAVGGSEPSGPITPTPPITTPTPPDANTTGLKPPEDPTKVSLPTPPKPVDVTGPTALNGDLPSWGASADQPF